MNNGEIMETRSYTTIDKSGWGEGEWNSEPDKIQWPDLFTGLPCLAVRHPTSGHWCGYVGVPEGHPYYEKDYDDVPAEVHWGLTYADHCSPSETEETGVCHVAEGDDHVWWLGFDCAHCEDLSPAYAARYSFDTSGEVYRSLEYVKAECASLAKQFMEVA